MKTRDKNCVVFFKEIPRKYEKFLFKKMLTFYIIMKMFSLLSKDISLKINTFYDLFSLTQCILEKFDLGC